MVSGDVPISGLSGNSTRRRPAICSGEYFFFRSSPSAWVRTFGADDPSAELDRRLPAGACPYCQRWSESEPFCGLGV
jgi:hypothetical protein